MHADSVGLLFIIGIAWFIALGFVFLAGHYPTSLNSYMYLTREAAEAVHATCTRFTSNIVGIDFVVQE